MLSYSLKPKVTSSLKIFPLWFLKKGVSIENKGGRLKHIYLLTLCHFTSLLIIVCTPHCLRKTSNKGEVTLGQPSCTPWIIIALQPPFSSCRCRKLLILKWHVLSCSPPPSTCQSCQCAEGVQIYSYGLPAVTPNSSITSHTVIILS